jgi:tRNA A-37 threonylcarbamoyl transferase component Bud32
LNAPRYEFLGKLGEGGAGAVYKAWDHKLQRHVAVKKLLPPEERTADGVGTDLVKEAAALSAFQHPNVVAIHDLEQIDGQWCVIMEFLNGETLENTVRRGALTKHDFIQVALHVLEGLVAAHRLGIQHRDIKPSNIMVNWLPNGDFLVKVLDFGLADYSAAANSKDYDAESTYGTVQFMAPEQFTRRPVDERTDLYSLGCVLYYALTAQYPFKGASMEAIIEAHLQAQVPALASQRTDLPPVLCHWVEWLMRAEPDKRPSSAQEALESFKQLLAGKLMNLPVKQTARVQYPVSPATARVPARPVPPAQRAAVASAVVVPAMMTKGKPAAKLTGLWITLGAIVGLTGVLLLISQKPSETPVTPSPGIESLVPVPLIFVAEEAKVIGRSPKIETVQGIKNIGYWSVATDYLSWPFVIQNVGTYEVTLEYALDKVGEGTEVVLSVGTSRLEFKLPTTGSWQNFARKTVGRVNFHEPGGAEMILKCITKKSSGVMNIRSISLVRK